MFKILLASNSNILLQLRKLYKLALENDIIHHRIIILQYL